MTNTMSPLARPWAGEGSGVRVGVTHVAGHSSRRAAPMQSCFPQSRKTAKALSAFFGAQRPSNIDALKEHEDQTLLCGFAALREIVFFDRLSVGTPTLTPIPSPARGRARGVEAAGLSR